MTKKTHWGIKLNTSKANRIRKIAPMSDSESLPLVLLEFQPIRTFQSSKEPFDDMKKVKSSIWLPFLEVYQKYQGKLIGL